jgi:hypothetical protein
MSPVLVVTSMSPFGWVKTLMSSQSCGAAT